MERQWFETKVVNGAPEHAVFAIQSDQGNALGLAQLSPIDTINRHARLGIYLADESARGKGLGERALRQLLTFGFNDLNLNKIFLEVTANNTTAINLYAKVGFVQEGLLQDHYCLDGDLVDVAIFSLFASNYG